MGGEGKAENAPSNWAYLKTLKGVKYFMELWQQLLKQSVSSVDQLVEKFEIKRDVAERLNEFFMARINSPLSR